MKFQALVLACSLTLTSLVSGCQELGESCNSDGRCCGETICHVPGNVCRAGNCQPYDYPCGGFNPVPNCCDGLVCIDGGCMRQNQADASAHLRGAIEAVKFVTEDNGTCRAQGQMCGRNPDQVCCPGLYCVHGHSPMLRDKYCDPQPPSDDDFWN